MIISSFLGMDRMEQLRQSYNASFLFKMMNIFIYK